jgi:hypothetical protein
VSMIHTTLPGGIHWATCSNNAGQSPPNYTQIRSWCILTSQVLAAAQVLAAPALMCVGGMWKVQDNTVLLIVRCHLPVTSDQNPLS